MAFPPELAPTVDCVIESSMVAAKRASRLERKRMKRNIFPLKINNLAIFCAVTLIQKASRKTPIGNRFFRGVNV